MLDQYGDFISDIGLISLALFFAFDLVRLCAQSEFTLCIVLVVVEAQGKLLLKLRDFGI